MSCRSLCAGLLLVSACGTAGPTLSPNAPGILRIALEKSVWSWTEVSGDSGSLRATLTNAGSVAVYARIGDAFNSATNQPDVFIAEGSDAILERRTGDGAWSRASVGILLEGVKTVMLAARAGAGAEYSLTGVLQGPRQSGIYRIRVDYFDNAGRNTPRRTDYSQTFEIR
ncbi:MAG: hypothetical protein ACT4R6_04770 [Gemmatimonadaceae bacterium]